MKYSSYLVLLFIILSCASQKETKHIFYLHGRIVEEQGRKAKSETFGTYEYDSILLALKEKNNVIHSEIRAINTQPKFYAMKISYQIDSLVKTGTKPKNITVVGASKGAIIASYVSTYSTQPINYVFLAGNNAEQEKLDEWSFHGNVLCFYDASDTIAGKNYSYWKNKSTQVHSFHQIEISKNLGHGFLYKPYREWLEPTLYFIHHQKIPNSFLVKN